MNPLQDIMDGKAVLTAKEKQILGDLAVSLAAMEGEIQAVYLEQSVAMAMALVLLTGLEVLDNDENDTLPRM